MKITPSYILRRIDIFGVPITFVGAHRLYYQTKFGGMVSVLMFGYLLYLIINQYEILINDRIIFSTTSNEFDSDPLPATITSANFIFAVRIEQTNFTNKPYFTFQLQWKEKINQTQSSDLLIPMRPCKMSDFSDLYFATPSMMADLQQNNVEDWVCPELQSLNIDLRGRFGSQTFRYLRLQTRFCDQTDANSLWQFSCPTDTQQFVQSVGGFIKVQFLFSNLNINPSLNQITGFIENQYFITINPFLQANELDMFLSPWVFKTDRSLFYTEAPEVTNYIVHNTNTNLQRSVVSSTEITKGNILVLYLRVSQFSNQSNISFQKIGTFLSYIGGLFNTLYIALAIFLATYGRYQLWLKLFKINYTIILQSYHMNRIQARMTRRNLSQFEQKSVQTNHSDITKNHIQNLVKEKYHQDNTIIPKIKHLWGFIFCWFKKGKKLEGIGFFDAIDVVEKDLNIVHYFKLIHDVQKLKDLLLNKEQRIIFDLQQRQTLIMKEGHFYVSETNHQNANEKTLRRASQNKIGMKSTVQDNSDMLDVQKHDLYGANFQKKILSEYLLILDKLNRLENQKQNGQKKLLALKEQPEAYHDQSDLFFFEQSVNKRLMNIFDEDIQDIISQDSILNPLCFPVSQQESQVDNYRKLILKEVLGTVHNDQNVLLLSERSQSQESEVELTPLEGSESARKISQQLYLFSNLLTKMGHLNGFTFQRDMSRLLSYNNKQHIDLGHSATLSLLKTVFFKEESFSILDEKLLIEYKSTILPLTEFSPQQVQYSLTIKLNYDKQNEYNSQGRLQQYKLSLNLKRVTQINNIYKEEYLAQNQRAPDSQSLALQFPLSYTNQKYSQFQIMITLISENVNYKADGAPKTVDNMYQQILDTSLRVQFEKVDEHKNSYIYLNCSLINHLSFEEFKTEKIQSIYQLDDGQTFKTHFYNLIEHVNQKAIQRVFSALRVFGSVSKSELDMLRVKSSQLRKFHQFYESNYISELCILKFRFHSQTYPGFNIFIILEIQQLPQSQVSINLMLNYPHDGSILYEMMSQKKKNFLIPQEGDESLEMGLIEFLEFVASLFIKLLSEQPSCFQQQLTLK